MRYSDAGWYVLVVGAAVVALLVVGGRAVRGLLGAAWRRLGVLRWVVVLITVVAVVAVLRTYPDK